MYMRKGRQEHGWGTRVRTAFHYSQDLHVAYERSYLFLLIVGVCERWSQVWEKKKNPGLHQSMLVVILFRWELMFTSQDLLYVRYPSECYHRNECPALAGETSSVSHVHDQRLMDITTRDKWLNGPIKREKKEVLYSRKVHGRAQKVRYERSFAAFPTGLIAFKNAVRRLAGVLATSWSRIGSLV